MLYRIIFTILCSLFVVSAFSQENLNEKGSALIVVDMQPHFVLRFNKGNTPGNIQKVDKLIKKQVSAIKEARKHNVPIIFVEYIINSGPLKEKQTDKRLVAATEGYDKVKYFLKSTNGFFEKDNVSKNAMLNYLKDHKLKKLIILGANGGKCVKSSITGALENDFNVVAYSRGIADFNYIDFIYPYDNRYIYKPQDGESCRYREVHFFNDFVKELTSPPKDVQKKEVNDSLRKLDKDQFLQQPLNILPHSLGVGGVRQ